METLVPAVKTKVSIDNVTGTEYTVTSDDDGKVKRFTDAAVVTVTLPVGVPVGTLIHLLFVGAGGGVLQGDGTSVVNGGLIVAQFGEASCLCDAPNNWNVQGGT